jgi:hypothetical protein
MKIASGELNGSGLMLLQLDTLGIINGCVDPVLNVIGSCVFNEKNTYGIPLGNTADCLEDFLDQVINNKKSEQTEPYFNPSDITHPFRDPFPPPYMDGFLNHHWVQKALGVPLNFTYYNQVVNNAFIREGSLISSHLSELGDALNSGVKVVLMYGDRDTICNWAAGEQVSLHIPHSEQKSFRKAGYAPIFTNPFYSGGLTRQFGNLSFSRIYQSGHMVPAYQPETAYRVFMRAMFNKDIATGAKDLKNDTITSGKVSAWNNLNEVLPAPEPVCYIRRNISATCPPEQVSWLRDGTAIVKDWIVIGRTET